MTAFSDHRVLVISGNSGIGKSALAMTLANQLNAMEAYQNLVAFIICRPGWNREDLMAEIAKNVFRVTGNKDQYSPSIGYSAETVTRMIEDNLLILFIDDLYQIGKEIFVELITAARKNLKMGRLLISSRTDFAGLNMKTLEVYDQVLEGLQYEECTQMVENLLKLNLFERFPDEINWKLFSKFKGNPFFVKMIVGLHTAFGLKIDEFLESFPTAEEEKNNHILRTVVNTISQIEISILKSLAVLRIPIRAEEFFRNDDDAHKSARRRLISGFMLEYDQEHKIYLHSVVRNHLLQSMKQEDLKNMHLDYAEHFAKHEKARIADLKEAYYHFQKGGDTKKAVDLIHRLSKEMLTLGRQTENFYYLLVDAIENCNEYREQDLIKSRIEMLIQWRQIQEAEQFLEQIKGKVDSKILAGKIAYAAGKYTDAVKNFEFVLKEDIPRKVAADIFVSLAVSYNYLDNKEKAKACFEKALENCQKVKAPLVRARCLLNYAVFLSERGKLYEALKHLKTTEDYYRKYNLPGLLATTIYNKAAILFELSELEEAVECLKESTEIKRRIKDHHGLVYTYSMQGEIYFQAQKYMQALTEKYNALELAKKFNWTQLEAYILRDIGEINTRIKKHSDAGSNFRKSLELFEQLGNPVQTAGVLQSYGQFLLFDLQIVPALNCFGKVMKLTANSKNPEIWAKASFFMAKAMELKNNPAKQKDYYAVQHHFLEKLPDPAQNRLKREFDWYDKNIEQRYREDTSGYFAMDKAKRYTDHTRIGIGRMGITYKVTNVYRKEQFAIKMLSEKKLIDKKLVQSFILGFGSSMQKLEHPNIAKILELVGAETPFVVMEWVDGESLRVVLDRKKKIKPEFVRLIGIQTAEALGHAHEKHVIHRDLRPENILLHQNRTVKVTDFGLERVLVEELKPKDGDSYNNFQYQPPEQHKGDKLTDSADLYSLGVCMYEFLTGKLPYDDEAPQGVLHEIQNTVPLPPSEHEKSLPQDFDRIIMKCLSKNPGERYQSAAELIAELEKVYS